MRTFILTVAALLLVQVPALFAQKVDLRNYVIGAFDANSNEMRAAGQRARRYWEKNGRRIGEKARYLARRHAERQVVDGDFVAVTLAEPPYLNHRMNPLWWHRPESATTARSAYYFCVADRCALA